MSSFIEFFIPLCVPIVYFFIAFLQIYTFFSKHNRRTSIIFPKAIHRRTRLSKLSTGVKSGPPQIPEPAAICPRPPRLIRKLSSPNPNPSGVYLYSDKFSAHLGALKSSGFESDIRQQFQKSTNNKPNQQKAQSQPTTAPTKQPTNLPAIQQKGPQNFKNRLILPRISRKIEVFCVFPLSYEISSEFRVSNQVVTNPKCCCTECYV